MSSGSHGVARGSGGHGSAGSSGGHGRWSLWPWPRSPRPGPYSQNPFTPPKKFPGEVRGYKEPSGAKQTGQYMDSPPGLNTQEQDRTGQDSPPGLNRQGQDRTAHRNRKPSWAGLEAEASSGHDEESGALTGSLSNRFHFGDRGARMASMATTRGAACPRRVSVDMTR